MLYNSKPIQQLKTAPSFEMGMRDFKLAGFTSENTFVFSVNMLYAFQALGFNSYNFHKDFKKFEK